MSYKQKMIVMAAAASFLPASLPAMANSPLLAQLVPPAVFMPSVPKAPTSMPIPPRPNTRSGSPKDESAIAARVLLMLASGAESDGKLLQAVNLYKQVVDIADKEKVAEYDGAIASGRLGALYADLGNYPQAIHFANRAMQLFESLEGPNNNDVAIELNNLGWLNFHQGHDQTAEKLYKQALTMLNNSNDENDDLVAVTQNNLGDLFMDGHNYGEAYTRFQSARYHSDRYYGANHPISKMIGKKLLRAKRLAGR